MAKTIDLIAKHSQHYAQKRVAKGARFTARREDANVLIAVGHAELPPVEPVLVPVKKAPAAKKAAATYQRKDMQAVAPVGFYAPQAPVQSAAPVVEKPAPAAEPSSPAVPAAPAQGSPVGGLGTKHL